MSLLTEYNTRPEDVGEILVKVQEDLQQLRDKLLAQGDPTSVDITALENAIAKTEEGIQSKTVAVLKQLNNQVLTLPSLEGLQRKQQGGISQDGTARETTWDLRPNAKGEMSIRRTGNDRMGLLESRDMSMRAPQPMAPQPPQGQPGGQGVITLKRVPQQTMGGEDVQTMGPTPGQQVRHMHQMRIIQNPYNNRNREMLNDGYGIQLPLIEDKRSHKAPQVQPAKGSTVEPLAVLPRANRVDPQLLPPPITEEDARKGILSLIERGLIPPAAELTLDPSPVRQKMAPLHDPQDKEKAKGPGAPSDMTFSLAGFKMDPAAKPSDLNTQSRASATSKPPTTLTPEPKSRTSSGVGRRHSAGKLKTPVTVKTLEMPLQPLPPPTTPASAPDYKEKSHRFAIQHGRTREQSQEFMAFKQHYCLSWGSIVSILRHLERMLTNYAVPIAFINGDKLADLSLEFELERPPSVTDLLSVIVNREDVEGIIHRPGRRYVGPQGRDAAASKIAATYKMHMERLKYLQYRKKKWAAGVIAISWVMHVKMSKVRRHLKNTRLDQMDAFRRRARAFARNWERISTSPRVIIHLPSLGHSKGLRETINDFNIYQNMQMARLCDIKDPKVDVLYISPVQVNEEMSQYYSKLLGLKHAIDSGDVDDQADVSTRYKVITPEAVQSFPSHRMCLSTLLKYSPRTLKRIKNLIRGREAYIVTGVPHTDDLYISDYLNAPMLSPEPEIAHLYSTKSGSKRIFASANVPMPPGEYDVYSLPQLHECLAQLVTEHLEVGRWLFKLDDEFDGRGIAYIDVSEHLPSYGWAVKEAARYGEKWSKKWAQEAAYMKIHAEIPDVLTQHAKPVNTGIYSSWEAFLEAFLGQGGIIEACPPSDSVTALTVDMLIEPNGTVRMVSNGDQIHAETPLGFWGLSMPQSSVEPEALNEVCSKVAEACSARAVVGYFTVDYVTFIHPKTMQQELWAVDLSLHYSDSLAMFTLTQFVTGGQLDPQSHYFDIPPPKKEEKKTRRRRVATAEETPASTSRYAVMSARLRHTNLSVVHYSVFFQMCRAHGIGYDVKEKQGTVFTLVDSFNRENMGMLTIGDNLQGALATFARNLSVVHQEISAPNMQGNSNFKPVIEDIESILGTTIQNATDQDETSETADTE